MKYSARASSFLLLICCAGASFSQTFGRFGYAPATGVPGFKFSSHGFQSNVPVADEFVFPKPTVSWLPVSTSAQSQTLDLGEANDGGPSQLRADLSVPGFSLLFPKGIDLQVGSIGAPFLSWSSGSVDQSVPTPPTSWVLVSFRQGQPPILFAFPNDPQAMIVDGEPGQWHLRTVERYSGWVRVMLPVGLDAKSPSTANSLGVLVAKINSAEVVWSGAEPKLLDTKITTDASSVTVKWTFDKAGALVPQSALLSSFGGYPVHVTTKINQLEGSGEEGPMAVAMEPSLAIRFPVTPWPECRYLAIGDAPLSTSKESSSLAEVANLAFAALSGNFTAQANAAAGQALMSFLSRAKGDVEPNTGLRLPYSASGASFDDVSVHAFLTQSLAVSNGTPSLPNPLLDQARARIDAYTWQPWNMEADTWRRASSLLAISCAMRSEPESRLAAGMLQAGLSARRGLDLWRYWRGDLTKLPQHLETIEKLRRRTFSLQGVATPDPMSDALFSPLRLCGPGQVSVIEKDGKTLLTWMALDASPGELLLSGPALKAIGAQNVRNVKLSQKGSRYVVSYTPTAAGLCALQVTLPVGVSIPAQVADGYAELWR